MKIILLSHNNDIVESLSIFMKPGFSAPVLNGSRLTANKITIDIATAYLQCWC